MARLFWMAVGAGAGMWAARKVKDKAQKYTPEGVADNVTGIGDAIRYFADEVRAGMAEREAELYRAIGADVTAAAAPPLPPPPMLTGRDHRALPAARAPYPARGGRDAYDPYDRYDAYYEGRAGDEPYDRRDTRDTYDRHENQQGFRLGIPEPAPAPQPHDRRDRGARYDRKDRRR
ncbi:DUF6167 family protein [Yinghuangia seranimata]|uniref:DUF6167 family protein n=1 Tax=Yinghuangia seranimata TaxID=408067 RepID=UPI00248AA0F8|nr:DUF6167 family protein [Yinghuangia seranimata]MDI2132091.1 DUF6167 family protein [Yinghuangia seranimata]